MGHPLAVSQHTRAETTPEQNGRKKEKERKKMKCKKRRAAAQGPPSSSRNSNLPQSCDADAVNMDAAAKEPASKKRRLGIGLGKKDDHEDAHKNRVADSPSAAATSPA